MFLVPLPVSEPPAPGLPENTYTVTKTTDELNGPCTAVDCSLREAIQAANQSAGLDKVVFQQPGVYLLTLPGKDEDQNQKGDLDVKYPLILSGENLAGDVVIDGNSVDRVFHIRSTAVVTFSTITIQHGAPTAIDPVGGGGVRVDGSLLISDTLVTNNNAGQGGGVSNSLGQLVILNSEISQNGASGEGGGVYSDGSLEIRSTSILSNTAHKGGGVSGTEYAAMSFSDAIFEHNASSTTGGAIFNDQSIDLVDVTLSYNQAQRGGAIFSYGDSTLLNVTMHHNQADQGAGMYNGSGTASFENVTLSANLAVNQGGGIFNDSLLTLQNVTLAYNAAPEGDNIYQTSYGEISLQNTILAGGVGDNCAGEISLIHSQGHNLESLDTCQLTGTGDKKNVANPGLAPLASNLGKTQTHALQLGSPAVDAANPSACPKLDQRYLIRPVDGNGDAVAVCDMGAFELFTKGLVAFSPLSYYTNEPSGSSAQVSFIVVRSYGSQQVEVGYALTTATIDLLPASGTLHWQNGDASPRPFNVTVLDDEFEEDDEAFTIQLVNPSPGLGMQVPNNMASLTIWANDSGGIVPPPFIYLPIVLK